MTQTPLNLSQSVHSLYILYIINCFTNLKKSIFKSIWYDDELYYLMVTAIPSNRSLMSTWTRSNRINITCILLISTNSDKWMKAFRSMPYPCIGPNFEEIYLSLTDLVFPPQWLLPHPECWHIYRLYNDALYKIENLTFTKDSLEKKKKYQISEYLKKKTLSSIINDFPKQCINVNIFSSHSKFTCIYNT